MAFEINSCILGFLMFLLSFEASTVTYFRS